jgi:hypothetical protein
MAYDQPLDQNRNVFEGPTKAGDPRDRAGEDGIVSWAIAEACHVDDIWDKVKDLKRGDLMALSGFHKKVKDYWNGVEPLSMVELLIVTDALEHHNDMNYGAHGQGGYQGGGGCRASCTCG